jgi:hypothetical protein
MAIAAVVLLTGGILVGGVVSDFIDEARAKLGPVLLANDLLVTADQEVTLAASLRKDLRLDGVEGKRLQFLVGDTVLGEVRTNKNGDAIVKWKTPEKPGDYTVRIRVNAEDQPSRPIEDVTLLVAARTQDTSIIVVDLDKTVVASGFVRVLLGDAKPMDGASLVLQRLAKTSTIVYLTQRPDFLGALSKRWLTQNAFPPGPVLTTSTGTLLVGSGPYKNTRLAEIKKTFANVAAGIGDKFSDAKAYADNGLHSILILQVDWTETDPKVYEKLAADLAALPDAVQVVTNWSQISAALLDKATFSKAAVEQRLRDVAKDLRSRGQD